MALMIPDARSAPRVPIDDSVVVERLPPTFAALRRLRGAAPATAASVKLEDALVNARRHVEFGQTYSDPRAYGYAQSALGPWWSADPAPPEIRVMRARILQFRHEFSAALIELEAALRTDQFNPDAWLLFASIAQVQGNVPAARSACLKLIPIADPLIGATCAASTAALGGHGDSAEALLAKALAGVSAASSAERCWAWTTLAEIRERNGDMAGAERAFGEALRLSPDDVYARAAYADLLLDLDRPREARALLRDPTQADALLLRAAIAAQHDHAADARALQQNLAARFAEAQARGDETHLREQARFALEVEHDIARALDLAQRNFRIQQEPADARVLLEAAHAASDAQAAQAAIEWLHRTGILAPRLLQLARAASLERAR